MDANEQAYDLRAFKVGEPDVAIPLDDVVTDLLRLVAERNPDFYELDEQGRIRAAS